IALSERDERGSAAQSREFVAQDLHRMARHPRPAQGASTPGGGADRFRCLYVRTQEGGMIRWRLPPHFSVLRLAILSVLAGKLSLVNRHLFSFLPGCQSGSLSYCLE